MNFGSLINKQMLLFTVTNAHAHMPRSQTLAQLPSLPVRTAGLGSGNEANAHTHGTCPPT